VTNSSQLEGVKPWLHVQLLHAIILALVDRRALK